jgi:pheromone shutdown protein TraB
MYCPRCAVSNQERTNFCRSCGLDLKTISLILDGQLTFPGGINEAFEEKAELTQQRRELQKHGLPRVIQGAILFVMGLLLAIPLNIFSANADWHTNWIIIWLIFCGWLPVLGALSVGTGLSNMIQARLRKRRIDRLTAELAPAAAILSRDTQRITEIETEAKSELPAALSVSEQTTEALAKPRQL